MNASFDRWRLVNTYGAFGSVGEQRNEVIVSLAHNTTTWHEVEFRCKPGSPRRRPCWAAPWHYRGRPDNPAAARGAPRARGMCTFGRRPSR
eukprot:gene57149-biopygen42717